MGEPIGTSWFQEYEWEYEFTCKCGCHVYQLIDQNYPIKICVQCGKTENG